MFKSILTGLCAVACMSIGFAIATASAADQPATPAATAPATQKAVDVKNTKCPVTGDDVGDGTFVYDGKLYHTCCSDCAADFKKNPDKYLKAMAADPAKYGIPK